MMKTNLSVFVYFMLTEVINFIFSPTEASVISLKLNNADGENNYLYDFPKIHEISFNQPLNVYNTIPNKIKKKHQKFNTRSLLDAKRFNDCLKSAKWFICALTIEDRKKMPVQRSKLPQSFEIIIKLLGWDDHSDNIAKEHARNEMKSKGFIDLTLLRNGLFNLENHINSDENDEKEFAEDYMDLTVLRSYNLIDNDYFDTPPLKVLNLATTQFNSSQKLKPNNKIHDFRRRSYKDSSDESSSESTEEEIKESPKNKFSKPKRFEVIDNIQSEEVEKESNEDASSSEEEIRKPTKVKNKEAKEKYSYVQSPTRHLKTSMISRRGNRLPHFLAKRYHWDDKDIYNLPYLWVSGPQDYYEGVYRKPY